ncbi:MAG: hypothetical protein JO006_03805 [Paucibacter sp.]|nr:hypothetical protein [Roseateles sp.]
MNEFLRTLQVQRWDDHRYYHHCRINQSLHFVSALSFLCAYALLFIDPAAAALLAWGVSMTTRQAGHFFFEPRGYDHVNQATDAHKEAIKVGYNIQRKIVLMSLWVSVPLLLWLSPSLFGFIEPAANFKEWWHQLGYGWLGLGVSGLLFRMGQLLVRDGWVQSLAWGTKIVTDPFHDAWLYHRAPLQLLRGERFDPVEALAAQAAEAATAAP